MAPKHINANGNRVRQSRTCWSIKCTIHSFAGFLVNDIYIIPGGQLRVPGPLLQASLTSSPGTCLDFVTSFSDKLPRMKKKIYPVSISWTPLCESISNFFYYIGLMISLLLLLSFLSVFNLKFIYYLFMLSFLPLCWSAYLKVYPAKSWVQPFSMVSVMADLYCQLDWVWNQLEDNIWDVYRVYLGMTKWAGSTLPHKSWHLLVVVTV